LRSLCGLVGDFSPVFLTAGQMTYVLLTRPPLSRVASAAFDLHVLGTPPAFILSQDQTRHPIYQTPFLQRVFLVCEDECVTELTGLNPVLYLAYHSSVVQVQ
jgi:hypothetical protein